MIDLNYYINEKEVVVKTNKETNFFTGEDITLSEIGEDITRSMSWYSEGFEIYSLEEVIDYGYLLEEITRSVKDVINKKLAKRDLKGFSLSKYHKFVSNEEHLLIDKHLKRFFPKDLGFEDDKIVDFIGRILNKKLSYSPQDKDFHHWIIVRLSLPQHTGLKGFNPAHKDIYEDYDTYNEIPRMVNAWIPICGVNSNTGLAIAPKSHLLSENKILRTKCGSFLEGNKFSVNCIKSWDNKVDMELISPNPGSFILFSSHLIHGLAINNNVDESRVSLEFRLHLNND